VVSCLRTFFAGGGRLDGDDGEEQTSLLFLPTSPSHLSTRQRIVSFVATGSAGCEAAPISATASDGTEAGTGSHLLFLLPQALDMGRDGLLLTDVSGGSTTSAEAAVLLLLGFCCRTTATGCLPPVAALAAFAPTDL